MKLILTKLSYYLWRPILGAPLEDADVDIYASRMLTDSNWFHRIIFPRFFSKMRIDADSLNAAKEKIAGSIPIYVTTYIGHLEYSFFNYLFVKEELPLAAYANGLTNWIWMTVSDMRKTKMARLRKRLELKGNIPHPVSSGYVEDLILNGRSIFVRLRTTRIHDDLYWEVPEEDVVQALIGAQRKIEKPLALIPQQFLWAKRPEKTTRSIIDWLFGERENPGRMRKTILFWRNYKSHAFVQFGEPLNLKDFIAAHPSVEDEELARILRSTLLAQTREERRRITGPAIKPRQWMIENTVEDELVQKEVYTISNERQKELDDVKQLAGNYAKEIAADIGYTYIEYGNRLLKWVFNTMYEGIHYNQEGFSRLKKIAQQSPVVFIPNHRSHMDYLLLSNLLYSNDIAVPHVAAGMNLSFWPLGKIFRKCGAFFIRRTFSGNPLYKAVFESYLRLLVKEGYCLEFFIEGTRSRTGKLKQPKMGMVSMLTDAMLSKSANELYFVPTSITYDKVIEEGIYVDEAAGKEKKKERFTDILKLGKFLKHRYGKIYVNIGEPISFTQIASIVEAGQEPGHLKIKIVEHLAYQIMSSLNEGAVATPSSLVAAAFLIEGRRGITSDQLSSNIELLKSYLEFMRIQLSETLMVEPERSIQEVIHRLASSKTIEAHTDFDPLYYAVHEDKRPSLNYQKNTIVHFLLPVAYVSASILALFRGGRDTFGIDEINGKVDFLKGIFTYEFAAHRGLVEREKIDGTLRFLGQRGVVELIADRNEVKVTALGTEILRRYRSIIKNSIDSYKIAHYACSKLPAGEPIDDKDLMKTMLNCGRHLLLLEKISRPEAINRPAFENAVNLFKTMGLLSEELSDEKVKEKKEYRWNRSIRASEELQQELELFS